MSPISQFSFTRTALIGVPENFMDTMKNEFYVPKSVQGGFDGVVPTLSDGDLNPVAMLYSDQGLPSYPETIPDVNT